MTSKFESMSDQELKQYFFQHRDEDSFRAYMDRKSLRPKRVLLEAGELDRLSFDEKVKVVEDRMRSHQGTKLPDSKNSFSYQVLSVHQIETSGIYKYLEFGGRKVLRSLISTLAFTVPLPNGKMMVW